MIIGIDGGALSVDDERLKVGVYKVTLRLLQEVAHFTSNDTYRVYSFRPIQETVLKQGENIENRVLPRLGWKVLHLPLELMMRPVDVFWGVSQMIPFQMPSLFSLLHRRTKQPFPMPVLSMAKNIGFIHDLGFMRHPEFYQNSSQKLKQQTDLLVSRSSSIVTISNATKTEILRYYAFPKDRIKVVYEGIDENFTPNGERFQSQRPYFLFVGALKRQKNIPFLIRAFNQFIRRTNKLYDLLLVGGDYWIDPAIYQEIQANHLEQRVKLLGHVPDLKLPSYYRGAEAFVSPSLIEGFCLPAAEAMACGCSVIGSTAGAMPEVIAESGILVDPYSEDQLCNALETIVQNKQLKQTLIDKGIIQSKKFSWKKFAHAVYDVTII